MNITCVIKFDFKVSELYLSINSHKQLLNWNNLTESYHTTFEYLNSTTLTVIGSKTKSTEAQRCKIELYYRNQLLNSQTFKIEGSKKNFQFDIENIYNKKDDRVIPFKGIKVRYRQKDGYFSDIDKSIKKIHEQAETFYWTNKQNGNVQKKEVVKENIIEVFYGTNRKKSGKNKVNEYFNDEIINGKSLNVGKCTISIPNTHKVGKVERPGKILIWRKREDKSKHILLQSINEFQETDFYNHLKESLLKTDENSFLLFVHGYNNSFEETAWRTGQIAYDLSFNGLTGFFSWPSAGKTTAYLRDSEMVNASKTSLTEFINSIITMADIKKLHIIAHSMGNVLVTASLNELASNPKYSTSLAAIEQIILAAPDIDQNVFKNEILPIFRNVGNSRTMYISDKDVALKASSTIRSLPRLGQAGAFAFVDKDLYSIDASNIESSGLNHSYIFDTKLLINDLFHLIEGITDPKKRNLKKDSELWYFPK
ncbi:alpha/beta hydrolase [Chryseobacterium sp. NRRL B-14798]|uniref:alpha/beta hydrolase n=1 Tax=Chryseobacterium sp. NRRL B-14798 TaxID=3162880 RepID=UPI003D1C20D4